MINRIKYRILLLAGIFIGIFCYNTFAQDSSENKYFIYIQNEGGTPFYVKKNNVLLSSTPSGYMIIPQLPKGKYQLTIGLPGNKAPEASFAVNIQGADDKGFLLKADNDKLNLYSLKDLSPVDPLAVASAAGNRIVDIPVSSGTSGKKKHKDIVTQNENIASDATSPVQSAPNEKPVSEESSDFAKMLNEITGKDEPVVAKTPQQKEPQSVEDSGSALVTGTEKPIATPETSSPEEQLQIGSETNAGHTKPGKEEPAFITFIPRQSDTTTTGATPVDNSSKVLSPLKKDSETASENTSLILEKPSKEEAVVKSEDVSGSGQENSSSNDFEAALRAAESTVHHKTVQVVRDNDSTEDDNRIQNIPNSDCKNKADAEDFQKVRRKMASRSDQESMYRTAEKYFKGGTCYTSAQIKSLTYLFSSDEYKYKFLELAYPHVYDTSHFPALVKTMADEYYQGRFNALIGK